MKKYCYLKVFAIGDGEPKHVFTVCESITDELSFWGGRYTIKCAQLKDTYSYCGEISGEWLRGITYEIYGLVYNLNPLTELNYIPLSIYGISEISDSYLNDLSNMKDFIERSLSDDETAMVTYYRLQLLDVIRQDEFNPDKEIFKYVFDKGTIFGYKWHHKDLDDDIIYLTYCPFNDTKQIPILNVRQVYSIITQLINIKKKLRCTVMYVDADRISNNFIVGTFTIGAYDPIPTNKIGGSSHLGRIQSGDVNSVIPCAGNHIAVIHDKVIKFP